MDDRETVPSLFEPNGTKEERFELLRENTGEKAVAGLDDDTS